ncbi:MAG: hypothetical protein P8R42_18755 [Candidatus Binatia bacterium]|nr:hypothetical protein [Candidatus Binatia bacterium]
MPTQPTQEQIEALANHAGDGRVVMLNIVRFKQDGGEAAYAKIGAKAI